MCIGWGVSVHFFEVWTQTCSETFTSMANSLQTDDECSRENILQLLFHRMYSILLELIIYKPVNATNVIVFKQTSLFSFILRLLPHSFLGSVCGIEPKPESKGKVSICLLLNLANPVYAGVQVESWNVYQWNWNSSDWAAALNAFSSLHYHQQPVSNSNTHKTAKLQKNSSWVQAAPSSYGIFYWFIFYFLFACRSEAELHLWSVQRHAELCGTVSRTSAGLKAPKQVS